MRNVYGTSIGSCRRVLVAAALALSTALTACLPGGYRVESDVRGHRGAVVRTARQYLGTPYRYGGASPRGFDCSGFTMYVYRQTGVVLPRAVRDQYRTGRQVAARRLRPGDLVFFNTRGKRLSHVGIYVGDDRFIHAPRTGKRVSYASLSKPYWRRHYVGAVSLL